MLKFENFRIITNGEKFRIEGSYKPINADLQWVVLSVDNFYFGTLSSGFASFGPAREFNTKEEATEYIKKEFGESDYRSLDKNWRVC